MKRPRVFIGSSSEGLLLAEAVFANISRETEPTLWTNQIFTPGAYPLEALEEAVRRNSFAILVASPDDEILKRGVSAPVMRDNLLVEFGLFAGALGRRRVFFVCPNEPRLDLPSDIFGLGTVTYDASRAAASASDRAAAVQAASQQIRDAIQEQWASLQKQEQERATRVQATRKPSNPKATHRFVAVARCSHRAATRRSRGVF